MSYVAKSLQDSQIDCKHSPAYIQCTDGCCCSVAHQPACFGIASIAFEPSYLMPTIAGCTYTIASVLA